MQPYWTAYNTNSDFFGGGASRGGTSAYNPAGGAGSGLVGGGDERLGAGIGSGVGAMPDRSRARPPGGYHTFARMSDENIGGKGSGGVRVVTPVQLIVLEKGGGSFDGLVGFRGSSIPKAGWKPGRPGWGVRRKRGREGGSLL